MPELVDGDENHQCEYQLGGFNEYVHNIKV